LAKFSFRAVRNTSGNLQIISWRLGDQTGVFRKVNEAGTSEAPVREIAMTNLPSDGVIIAVSDGAATLIAEKSS
jgi:hypothetical protein